MLMNNKFVKFLRAGFLNFIVGYVLIILFSLTQLSNFFVVLFSHCLGLCFNFFSYKAVFHKSWLSFSSKKIIYKFIFYNIFHIFIFTFLIYLLNPITGDRMLSVLIISGPITLLSYFFYKRVYL